MEMTVGNKVKFKFGKAKNEKEGLVTKIFQKTVYLRVDFPNHKGKLIKIKKHELMVV